jgi:hypothetical protein
MYERMMCWGHWNAFSGFEEFCTTEHAKPSIAQMGKFWHPLPQSILQRVTGLHHHVLAYCPVRSGCHIAGTPVQKGSTASGSCIDVELDTFCN